MSRIESGAEYWPICGLQCGIQLHARKPPCLACQCQPLQHHRHQHRQAGMPAIPRFAQAASTNLAG